MSDLDNIPAPLATLFGLVANAFDLLEETTGQEVALDLFFEEVEFEGEKPRICLTVNDLVSAYHEGNTYTVVLTLADGDDPHPWFTRETPEAAAGQVLRLLADAEFLTEHDLAAMRPAVEPEAG
jgi:hypothetical protein